MTEKPNNRELLELRLSSIETKLIELESFVRRGFGILDSQTEPSKKTGRAKMTSDQKASRKKSLLEAGPYSEEQLEGMPGPDLKFLAAAMGLDSFGIQKDVLVLNILEGQEASSKSASKTAKKPPAKKAPATKK